MLALEEEACGVDESAAVIFMIAICAGLKMLVPVYFMQSRECCCISSIYDADDFCVGRLLSKKNVADRPFYFLFSLCI